MREHHTSDELIWEGFIKRAVMMEHDKDSFTNPDIPPDESDKLNALTEKAVRKEAKHFRRLHCRRVFLRVVVCLFVLLTIVSVIVMNVKPLKIAAMDAALSILPPRMYFRLSNYSNLPPKYVPTWIPERYPKQKVLFDDPHNLIIWYFRDPDDLLSSASYQLLQAPSDLVVNTENMEITNVIYNDQQYSIIHEQETGYRMLLGVRPETGNSYTISGYFSEEEILKMADSIEYRPRGLKGVIYEIKSQHTGNDH